MASTRVVCMTFLIVSFSVLLHSDPIKGVGLSSTVFYKGYLERQYLEANMIISYSEYQRAEEV